MKNLEIDLETYSSASLQKCGVYKYAESPDFEILLFGYSADGGEVRTIDLASGEKIPEEVLDALTDDAVTKWAFNAQFERICLSRYLADLGRSSGRYLDPEQWRCVMVWSAYMGLPLSLEGVGAVLGLEKQKLTEGKELICWSTEKHGRHRDGAHRRGAPQSGICLEEIQSQYRPFLVAGGLGSQEGRKGT